MTKELYYTRGNSVGPSFKDLLANTCIFLPVNCMLLRIPVSGMDSKMLRNFWTKLDKNFLSFSCLEENDKINNDHVKKKKSIVLF